MISVSGLKYETKIETLKFNAGTAAGLAKASEIELMIEQLSDIDKTIDRLFERYQAEGRTDLFEEMCPYFGTLWPAGRVLAEYLSQQPLPAERRILEVGCGLAVPSLYLAKALLKMNADSASGPSQGSIELTATDLHPDVPLFLERNRELNQTTLPRFEKIDWSQASGQWDLILASDVLYDKSQPASLLGFLKRCLAPGGRFLLADPGRTYVQGFFDDARGAGFRVKTSGLFGVLIGELTRDVVS